MPVAIIAGHWLPCWLFWGIAAMVSISGKRNRNYANLIWKNELKSKNPNYFNDIKNITIITIKHKQILKITKYLA